MKLHEAIEKVLIDNRRPMSAAEIASAINYQKPTLVRVCNADAPNTKIATDIISGDCNNRFLNDF